ncbi:MG284/MPN403 family protein [Mycoplasmopsis synoviae]|uniref:MG284/MPN403 family protein n=1 Tax=Mycoplasmopsis synoviae TaxID=2109 RepID=UPI001EF7726B|nr:hypothetical protein [Mycoplasmopsis synoviae]ULL02493.1 hypothetical protein JM201_00370 [Mycoplasmopsis synoviae]
MKNVTKSDENKKLRTECNAFVKQVFLTYEAWNNQLKKQLLNLKFKESYLKDKNLSQEVHKLEIKIKASGSMIQSILSVMKPENSWIIEKCFLDKNTRNNSLWYKDYFSKSTFYKRKNLAVKEFAQIYFDF